MQKLLLCSVSTQEMETPTQLPKPEAWDLFLVTLLFLTPTLDQSNLSFNLVNSTLNIYLKLCPPLHLHCHLPSSLTTTPTVALKESTLTPF